jgi:hypothetical protein
MKTIALMSVALAGAAADPAGTTGHVGDSYGHGSGFHDHDFHDHMYGYDMVPVDEEKWPAGTQDARLTSTKG